jgi:hypothetical protein
MHALGAAEGPCSGAGGPARESLRISRIRRAAPPVHDRC